jgi:hypothetical protein
MTTKEKSKESKEKAVKKKEVGAASLVASNHPAPCAVF